MKPALKSRFDNSARNVFFSLIAQIFAIVLNIVGRKVFVTVLDAEYLGVSTAFYQNCVLALLVFIVCLSLLQNIMNQRYAL